MATFDTSLSVKYDSPTYETWLNLFGNPLTTRINARLKDIEQKHPCKDVTLLFDGDIDVITEENAEKFTTYVAYERCVQGTRTLKSHILNFSRKIFGSERPNQPSAHKLKPTIICTVVLVPLERSSETSDVG